MTELNGTVGFTSPIAEKNCSRRRRAGVELLATVALAISLIIAATAVSIGMARAQTLRAVGAAVRHSAPSQCVLVQSWPGRFVRSVPD